MEIAEYRLFIDNQIKLSVLQKDSDQKTQRKTGVKTKKNR